MQYHLRTVNRLSSLLVGAAGDNSRTDKNCDISQWLIGWWLSAIPNTLVHQLIIPNTRDNHGLPWLSNHVTLVKILIIPSTLVKI